MRGPRERDAQARLDHNTRARSPEEAERMSDRVWDARERDRKERHGRDPWSASAWKGAGR